MRRKSWLLFVVSAVLIIGIGTFLVVLEQKYSTVVIRLNAIDRLESNDAIQVGTVASEDFWETIFESSLGKSSIADEIRFRGSKKLLHGSISNANQLGDVNYVTLSCPSKEQQRFLAELKQISELAVEFPPACNHTDFSWLEDVNVIYLKIHFVLNERSRYRALPTISSLTKLQVGSGVGDTGFTMNTDFLKESLAANPQITTVGIGPYIFEPGVFELLKTEYPHIRFLQ